MRFPIQFNLSLIKAGLSADERRAIRESIADNMQNFQTVQNRLQRFDVSMPNILKTRVDYTSIYRVNRELIYYKEYGYTEYEAHEYDNIIDDLITIGIYNVTREDINKLQPDDFMMLILALSKAIYYNDLYLKTGDIKFEGIVDDYRESIKDIFSKYQ